MRNPLSECAIRQKSALSKVTKIVYVELFSLIFEEKFVRVGIELKIVNFRIMAYLANDCGSI